MIENLTPQPQSELKKTLYDWTLSRAPGIGRRTTNYGLKPEQSIWLVDDINTSFATQIGRIDQPEKVALLQKKAASSLSTEPFANLTNIDTIRSSIDNLGVDSLSSLLQRKLAGQIDRDEAKLLSILNYTTRGDFSAGNFSVFTGRIEIGLLNQYSLEQYDGILHHELTHFCVTFSNPESALAILATKISKKEGFQGIKKYGGVMAAMDESAAFRAQAYFGQKWFNVDRYQHRIDPIVFQNIYGIFDLLAENRSLDEFDVEIAEVFRLYCKRYSGYMTEEDADQAIFEVIANCTGRVIT